MFYLRMSWERSENLLTHDQFSFEQKKTDNKSGFQYGVIYKKSRQSSRIDPVKTFSSKTLSAFCNRVIL